MQLDVVNASNQKVGALDLRDEVFGQRVRTDLIWEAVRHEQAGDRAGTHATKSRGMVQGSGRKLWKQKGTGRARVSDVRNPIWRKGGTVFGPQPRSYDYQLPRKVELGALRAALAAKIQGGAVVVVDALSASAVKTKAAVGMLKTIGVTGKALLVDVQLDEKLALSVRNVPGVVLLPSNRITARDVASTKTVVVTQAALEKLEAALG
jgi:large subunit ribosomal protein L4